MDNSTPYAAADYERNVARTIPFHAQLVEQAVDAALTVQPGARRWLDTGCGPAALALHARTRCAADFWLADPSAAMLAIAKGRHADLPTDRFLAVRSEDLPELPPFDVITAVQCHHYGDEAARARAVRRCWERLAPGGAFVTFENVRAESPRGHAIQRERWAAWLRAQGSDEAQLRAQLDREGTKYFPLRVSEHVALLSRIGFPVVELCWRSYAQAGFVCVKT